MWNVFLLKWNGRSVFLESTTTSTPDLELYKDAAGSVGFGVYFQGKWFQGHWPPHMLLNRERGISIKWQELSAIVVACAIWHPHFKGKRLQFWCDNESVVSIINSLHSKAPLIMDLVRKFVLLSMEHDFLARVRHVPLPLSDAAFLGPRTRRRQISLYYPAFTDDPLRKEVLTHASWGLSKNTNRAYSCGEKRFLQFCLMNRLLGPDGDVLPASEETHLFCLQSR